MNGGADPGLNPICCGNILAPLPTNPCSHRPFPNPKSLPVSGLVQWWLASLGEPSSLLGNGCGPVEVVSGGDIRGRQRRCFHILTAAEVGIDLNCGLHPRPNAGAEGDRSEVRGGCCSIVFPYLRLPWVEVIGQVTLRRTWKSCRERERT